MPNTTVPAAGEAMSVACRVIRLKSAIWMLRTARKLSDRAERIISFYSRAPFESPIIALFHEWDALYVEGYISPALDDDDECTRICLAMKELEHKMAALPARTAPELAAKLIALSTFGEYGLDDFKDSVFTDARALIGRAAL
jgi:hypothetical protein